MTYNNVLGAKGVTLSTNYVASNGQNAGTQVGAANAGGIATSATSSVSVTQLAYTGGKAPLVGGSAWSLAAAYTYAQNTALPSATPLAGLGSLFADSSNSIGISGYWVPESTGWIPSVSTGWGYSNYSGVDILGLVADENPIAQSWYVGLQWPDTFVKGNDLGMAVGQAPFTTRTGYNAVAAKDSNYMWEWWYKFQVTDNITVTPAIYYINNYQGQIGKLNANLVDVGATDKVFGGLLKTTFKF